MSIPFTYILASSIMISASLFTSERLPVVTATDVNSEVASRSPHLPQQEIIDPRLDWIDLTNNNLTTQGDRSTDIESVDYSSDGKTLNATLWLYFPFKANHSSPNEEVSYGMLIDTDFDRTTGYAGIDYKVETSWDNESKKWTKVLEKGSHYGHAKTLSNNTIPISSFSENGAHYVTLSADLDDMLYPNKYKVIFYGEDRREDSWRLDYTRWVSVPQLELKVSSLSPNIELRPGETKVIGVQINSSQGYEHQVGLVARSPSDEIVANSRISLVSFPSSDGITIITMPLRISASEDARVGPHTVFIFANSTLKPAQFIQGVAEEEILRSSAFTEDIFTQSSISLVVRAPLTLTETIFGPPENSVNLNIPQEYLIGLYGLVLTFLVPMIVRWFTRNRQSKRLGDHMIAINAIYDRSSRDKGEAIKSLEEARREVSIIYAKGEISESDYKILK